MESFELLVDQAMMKRKCNRIEYRPTVGSPFYPRADKQRERMKMSSKRESACVTWAAIAARSPRSQENELLTVLIGVNGEVKCSCEDPCEDSCSSSGEILSYCWE
jgi:hypothetical protein